MVDWLNYECIMEFNEGGSIGGWRVCDDGVVMYDDGECG